MTWKFFFYFYFRATTTKNNLWQLEGNSVSPRLCFNKKSKKKSFFSLLKIIFFKFILWHYFVNSFFNDFCISFLTLWSTLVSIFKYSTFSLFFYSVWWFSVSRQILFDNWLISVTLFCTDILWHFSWMKQLNQRKITAFMFFTQIGKFKLCCHSTSVEWVVLIGF